MHLWLPGLVAAQALGIVAADRGVAFEAGPASAAGLCIAAAALMCRRSPRTALALLTCGFACIGGLSLDRRALGTDAAHTWPVAARTTIEARVENVRTIGGRIRIDLGEVRSVEAAAGVVVPHGLGRIRLHVDRDEPAYGFLRGRRRGERLRARVSVRPIDGPRNPGAPDRRAPSRRRGVWADARLADPDAVALVVHGGEVSARPRDSGAAGRRQTAIERLVSRGPGGALLAALGLGASGTLDPGLREALAGLGLSHLVAVSGLHLAMVAALAFSAASIVVRLTRAGAAIDPLPWKSGAAVFAAFAYAALSGFGVPVRRAWLLLVIALVLHATGRRSAWIGAWCVAAAVVLAFDPAALFELGPQLSFGVTAALASARLDGPSVSPAAATRLTRSLARVVRLLEVSAVALAASALILALHGRSSSEWALLANVVAVPLTAFVVLPASLFAGAIAFAGLEGPAFDALIGALASGLAHLDVAVRAASSLVETPGSMPMAGRFALALAALCVVGTARAPTPSLRGAAALTCVGLLGLAPGDPSADAERPSAGPELVAFDVGQGDALLLRDADTAILVDAGWADPSGGWDAGARVVVPGLRALGVRRLDLLVVTHADLDHRGGVAAVLDALPVERVWVPAPVAGVPALATLRHIAIERGAQVEERARAPAVEAIGGFGVEVLWPPRKHVAHSPNESSLVLGVRAGAARVLLMGDAGFETERALLAGGSALGASVLKLGHHGSRTATSAAFLAAVRPEWAVVSAGCSVGRALPHDDALERVLRSGAHVAWTGRDGAVRLSLDGFVRAARGEHVPARRLCRVGRAGASALPLQEPSRRVGRRGNARARDGVGGARSSRRAAPAAESREPKAES